MKKILTILLSLFQVLLYAQSIEITNGDTTKCSGFFYDTGLEWNPTTQVYENYNYGNNENFVFTICPDIAQNQSLIHFTSFNVHSSDQLCIYDGDNTSAPLIGCYTGSDLLNVTIEASVACLTFQFTSDGSNVAPGWTAEISCDDCQQVISNGLTVPNLTSDSQAIQCFGDTTSFFANPLYPQNDLYYHQDNSTSTFNWYFGDGSTSNDMDPMHTYSSAGEHLVSLVVEDINGCKDSAYIGTIIVSNLPNFSGTHAVDSICYGEELILIGQTEVDTIEYTIGESGNGTSLPDGNGNSYESTLDVGLFDPLSTIQSGNQISSICIDIEHSWMRDLEIALECPDGTTIILHDHPGTIGGEVHLGEPNETDEGLPDPIPGIGYTYCWDMSSTNGTWIEYANAYLPNTLPAGDYEPYESFDGLVGCPMNGEWNLIVTDLWSIDNGVVFGWSINFSGDGPDDFTTLIDSSFWSFDGTFIEAGDTTHLYYPDTFGTLGYTYTVKDTLGCYYDTIVNAVVHPLPEANFASSPNCLNIETHFTDLSFIPDSSNVISWNWDFDDGNVSANANPSNTYLVAGTYDVYLEVESAFGCVDDTIIPITINDVPEANFSFTEECLNGPAIQFNDLSNINTGNIAEWHWDFGNGDTSIVQNPNYSFPTAQLSFVTLEVVSDSGCPDDTTLIVETFPLPEANFISDSVCLGADSVFFTNTSQITSDTITNWYWTFTDANIIFSTDTNPSNYYSDTGVYNVQLIVETNHNCFDTVDHTVLVHDLPMANFIFSLECENGDSTHFQNVSNVASGTIDEVLWDFAGLDNSTVFNPYYLFPAANDYPVQLIVYSNYGCTDTITKNVTVLQNPMANFNFTEECLEGPPLVFQNASTTPVGNIDGYNWIFGDGDSSSQVNPSHIYLSSNVYNVTLEIVTDLGCVDDTMMLVEVYPLPVANFSSTSVCLGADSTYFTDLSSIFTDTIISWNWNFGSLATSTVQHPSFLYATPGLHDVTLMVETNHGCQDQVQGFVDVFELPISDFNASTECVNEGPTQFQSLETVVNDTIALWDWDFATYGSSNLVNPSFKFQSKGVYAVRLAVETSNGCRDTAVKDVEVLEKPFSLFSIEQDEGCIPYCSDLNTISYTGSGNITSWVWMLDNSIFSTDTFPEICFSDSGEYLVSLIVKNSLGCSDTNTKPMLAYPLPDAQYTFYPPERDINSPFVKFYDHSTGKPVTWFWDFGDDKGFSDEQMPLYQFLDTGKFPVELIVWNEYGCKDSITHIVTIDPVTNIFVPNIFTPNEDRMNDSFFVKGYGIQEKDFLLSIFDRWGDLIFQTDKLRGAWDGTFKGKPVQQEVYIYQVNYKDVFGESHETKGKITLIR